MGGCRAPRGALTWACPGLQSHLNSLNLCTFDYSTEDASSPRGGGVMTPSSGCNQMAIFVCVFGNPAMNNVNIVNCLQRKGVFTLAKALINLFRLFFVCAESYANWRTVI